MTILDEVKAFVLTLKKYTWTDKTKAEHIRDYILNIEGIVDGTKKNMMVQIKPFVIEHKILNDDTFVSLINSRELYDKIFRQSDAIREVTNVLDIDMNIIEKLLKFKNDKVLNLYTGEYEIDKYSIYIYLLFTSGMRTNEITNNSFTIVDNNTLKAERISKKDNNGQENLVNLLIPAEDWIILFNDLQTQLISRNIYKPSTVAGGIKRKLINIHPQLHAHSLRKLYLAYHLQVKKTGADRMPSINTKRLLNHTNEAGSVFYNGTIKITGELADIIDNTDYTKLKVVELKIILKSKNIKYKHNIKKADLIALIKTST